VVEKKPAVETGKDAWIALQIEKNKEELISYLMR